MKKEENAEQASWVIHKASLAEGRGLTLRVLHSNNGSTMKGTTMRASLLLAETRHRTVV